MGYLFDEKQYVEENIFLHESRLSSQYSRFLDKSPTFTTYYRVNNIESTTDRGFLNVERLLGNSSPIRFNEVTRLPIYGIDQIVLDLNLEDQGLDTEFNSSAILLPNTVIPRPNDFFVIDHLGSSIVFMVTNIAFDTIRTNNYYRIDYKVKAVDDGETHASLKKQTVDHLVCYHENIGTEDKVLVRSVDADIIKELNKISTDIANYYKMLYYNNRYNSFMYNDLQTGYRYYDRVLTKFINKNKLFSNKKGYDTIFLADEDPAITAALEYHNSVFRAVEDRDPSILKEVKCYDSYVFQPESIFVRWRDKKVISTVQGMGVIDYVRPDLLDFFRNSPDIFNIEEEKESSNDLNELYPNGSSIIIPDKNDKPVYVEDMNILVKYADVIKDEPDALKIKREEDNTGGLDVDSIIDGTFFESSLPSLGNEAPPGVEITPIIPVIIDPPNMDFFPDEPTVLAESIPIEESTDVITFDISKVIPDYLKTPDNYNKENIMSLIIAKYFSGKDISLYELDLKELKNYVEYMDINSKETFILTPIFLYVLEQYFIKHLES